MSLTPGTRNFVSVTRRVFCDWVVFSGGASLRSASSKCFRVRDAKTQITFASAQLWKCILYISVYSAVLLYIVTLHMNLYTVCTVYIVQYRTMVNFYLVHKFVHYSLWVQYSTVQYSTVCVPCTWRGSQSPRPVQHSTVQSVYLVHEEKAKAPGQYSTLQYVYLVHEEKAKAPGQAQNADQRCWALAIGVKMNGANNSNIDRSQNRLACQFIHPSFSQVRNLVFSSRFWFLLRASWATTIAKLNEHQADNWRFQRGRADISIWGGRSQRGSTDISTWGRDISTRECRHIKMGKDDLNLGREDLNMGWRSQRGSADISTWGRTIWIWAGKI